MAVQYHGSTAVDIASSVETAIRDGELTPGDALPPVRRLAVDLGVSPATVAAAYRDLRQRAVIETAGRAGTRVRDRPAVRGRRGFALPPPPGGRDLSLGGPDPRLLPVLAPHLARLAAEAGATQPAGYERAGALPELLAAARDRLPELPGSSPPAGMPELSGRPGPPGWPGASGSSATGGVAMTVTSGALDGIERTLGAHLAPGDRVAVEDPGWANLLDLLAALRLTPVGMPLDDEGPTPDGLAAALAAGARAVVITSRAQNPTGAAVSADRSAELRAVLAGHPGVLVIEDDHAAELSEVALHPVVGSTGSWVFVRSVSKPYGPDLRLAVLAGDEATTARVIGRQRLGAGWVSTVLQRLVLELWRDPAVAALVARARTEYAARRDGLRAALTERGVPAVGRTGINVWVPVADETSAVARLRDAGWGVAPGTANRLASGPALRITVSGLAEADLAPLAGEVAAALAPAPSRYGA